MFYNKKIVKNMNEVNMVDVVEQLIRKENGWFSRKLRNNDVSDFFSSRKDYNAKIDALNKCYFIDTREYVEKILKHINGEHAYSNNNLSNLTCTYAKLWLPIVEKETNAVFVEEHPAIFYTGREVNQFKYPKEYTVEDAKSAYEYILKQIYQNKMVLLKEDKNEIDVTPLRKPDTFSFDEITYDRYPTYHLVPGGRQDPEIMFGIMDRFANQLILGNLERENIKVELVEQKSLLKNISKVFKRGQKSNCNPILRDNIDQKQYKVKLTNGDSERSKSTYLKRVNRQKNNTVRQYGD